MSGGLSRAQNRVFNIFGPQRYECLISLFNARTRRDELNSVSGLIITRKSVHWTTECLYDFDHADESTYLILYTDDTIRLELIVLRMFVYAYSTYIIHIRFASRGHVLIVCPTIRTHARTQSHEHHRTPPSPPPLQPEPMPSDLKTGDKLRSKKGTDGGMGGGGEVTDGRERTNTRTLNSRIIK